MQFSAKILDSNKKHYFQLKFILIIKILVSPSYFFLNQKLSFSKFSIELKKRTKTVQKIIMKYILLTLQNKYGIIQQQQFYYEPGRSIIVGQSQTCDFFIDYFTLSAFHLELIILISQKLSIKLFDNEYKTWFNQQRVIKKDGFYILTENDFLCFEFLDAKLTYKILEQFK